MIHTLIHSAKAGWEPPKTPALWKGVDGPGGGAANPPPGNQWQGIPGAEGGPHEEKHWYDMDDHKKNELLVSRITPQIRSYGVPNCY